MPTYLRPGMGLFSPNRVAATATTRMLRVGLVLIAAFALMGAAAGAAQAAGTITVQKGGLLRHRHSRDAAALGGTKFQYAAYVNNVDLASWFPLCTDSDNDGSCTGPSLANGRYLVRESRGAGRLARIPGTFLGRRLVGPEPDPRLRRQRARHEQLESHRPPVQRLARPPPSAAFINPSTPRTTRASRSTVAWTSRSCWTQLGLDQRHRRRGQRLRG